MQDAVMANRKESKAPKATGEVVERLGGGLGRGDVQHGELGDADVLQVGCPLGILQCWQTLIMSCATMLWRMIRGTGSRVVVRGAEGRPMLGPERGGAQTRRDRELGDRSEGCHEKRRQRMLSTRPRNPDRTSVRPLYKSTQVKVGIRAISKGRPGTGGNH